MKILIFFLLTLVAFSESSSYDDEVCDNQLNLFSNALESREFWALELFDSWAKIHAGYLSGNVQNLGNFDQCRKFQYDTKSSGKIHGQFCLVTLEVLTNSTLEDDRNRFDLRDFANFFRTVGITHLENAFCLPDSCNPVKTVEFLNQEYLNKNEFNGLIARCYTDDHKKIKVIDVVAIVIFSLFLLALIASTIYELHKKAKNEIPDKLFASFSVYTNGFKLYDITKYKTATSINCIHGLRVMSIFYIIIGHRIFNHFLWGNPIELVDFTKSRWSALTASYHIAVDTFFVLGAILMTFSIMREIEKGQLNIVRTIWRRYLRYTPALAALILFSVSLFKFLVNGPLPISTYDSIFGPCSKNWWRNILQIQNLFSIEDMCLNHTWYLGADFQLFIISPFILRAIYKFGRKMLALPVIFFLISISYIIAMTVILGISSPNLYNNDANYMLWIYFSTQSRCGPWFIGMMLGYFMYQHRGKTFKINPFLNAFMWIFTISLLVTVLLVSHEFQMTNDIKQAGQTTFMVCQRNLWALSICWIIFACQHLKTGGFVRWFLSLPQWQPIGRMGLSMYLFHIVYQLISMGNQRVFLYLNFWQLIPVLISDIVVAIVLATIAYLAFESPMLIMEDYFYKKMKGNKN